MAGKARKKNTQRRFIVFASLVGVLSGTSALLLALAPAPLRPEPLLIATNEQGPELIQAVFKTQTPADLTQWKYIYVHHSKSLAGDATTLSDAANGAGDHFIIGNGQGLVDGEIQMSQRWNLQQSATPPAGAAGIDRACISICVVGDFDQFRPSGAQFQRLSDLVRTLQARYRISAKDVMLVSQPSGGASIGRYFPVSSLREQLLP